MNIDIKSWIIGFAKGKKSSGAIEELETELNEQESLIAELKDKLADGVSGGGSVKKRDINFYDYDGTLLYSYTVKDAQELTELPKLPTQEGLICQGWNYDLETIKAHNRALNIGATYITDDGKTRLYIKIAAEGRMDVPLYFNQNVTNGVTIDWGDGSATQTLDGTGNVNTTHTYASIGEYVISLEVADGCTLGLGHNSSQYCVMGKYGDWEAYVTLYRNRLKKVEIGNGVTRINNYAFQYCYNLESIVIPNGVTSIVNHAFYYCDNLASIVIPNSVTSISFNVFQNCYKLASVSIPDTTNIGNYVFSSCYNLESIVIPNGVTSITNQIFNFCRSLSSVTMSNNVKTITSSAFAGCYNLTNIAIPNSVTKIETTVFQNCYGMKFYDFSQHTYVPTLSNTNAFNGIPSDCEIRVPMALVDEWKAATNWSTYADKIVGV
jgi:hypothetical protein